MTKKQPEEEPEEDYDEELDEDYDPTKLASDEESEDSDEDIPTTSQQPVTYGRFVTDANGLVKSTTSLDINSIFDEMKRGQVKRQEQQQEEEIPESLHQQQQLEKNEKQIKIQTSYTYAGKLITETKLVDADSEEAKAYLNSTSSVLSSDDGKTRSEVNVVRKDVITGEMVQLRIKLKRPSLIDRFNGRNKKSLSTLEKSRLDWASFVDQRRIGDELKKFNKAGYLDKQAFLGRVDIKRDEKYVEAKEAAALAARKKM